MAIQKQFVLRYKEEGHLRFEIPKQFCETATANALTAALLALDGVYRVSLYTGQQKLSIRYQESVCDFKTLAKLLFQIIADIEKTQLNQPLAAAKSKLKEKLKNLAVSRWFGQKYGDTKETIQAAKILSKRLKNNKIEILNDPEKALFDFLTDVLVLFLIRTHWDHIIKQWLPNPFKYRYEWMAVFYMLMLLMRSKKPK